MCYLFILFFILFAEMERSLFVCLVILWFSSPHSLAFILPHLCLAFFLWSTIIVFFFILISLHSVAHFCSFVFIMRTAEHDRKHHLNLLQITQRWSIIWHFHETSIIDKKRSAFNTSPQTLFSSGFR